MDVDEPFRYRAPPYPTHNSDNRVSSTSSRSSQIGPASRRRSSHSGHSANSRTNRPMSMITRRPPPLREPIAFQDEAPAPPRVFHQPPPLAPYVTPEQRVHPPRVSSWGSGPDPGVERHLRSNPHPSLPTPIHQPPRGDGWRRTLHAGTDHHPYARPTEPDSRNPPHSHPNPPPHRSHIVHPPPHRAAHSGIHLPSIHDALSNSSMERSYSHASEPALPTTRPYAQSQGGSSGSRPNSHGSSGGEHSPTHPGQSSGSGQRRRRTRALMTDIQQSQLKQLWKKTKFPGKPEREEVGEMIGLTPRQVQVWFQNQRQKTRKEISDTGVPLGADPRDYDDLDKSPRSRRMSLEASDAASKVQQWKAVQSRMEVKSHGTNEGYGQPTNLAAEPSHRDLSHLIKNPDVRPALPGPRLSSQMSETSDRQRPQFPAVSATAPSHHWKSGYRTPVPLSPISHSAMTPSLGGTPSPTQLTFGERPGRHRHRPVAPAALSAALTDPYRSPIEVSFSHGVPMRQSHTIDNIMPVEAPRRRSTSLEGMRPSRTPSPRDAPSKRSRTHTVISELPPSLAALALSAPIHESPSHSRQLPKLSPGSVVQTQPTDMFVALPPTLPPPRGRANERMDGHYRSHTDSTQITLQRQAQAQRRLPGPDDLLRPATDYR